ncbi:hypothetical protein WJ70_23500 [Burkholderia ubonensis]|nr:hypothetical protein [Burkholderia ubonensis]KVO08165.1 hypothetical protein WJ70_23500 [Burkholderia ubonensis]
MVTPAFATLIFDGVVGLPKSIRRRYSGLVRVSRHEVASPLSYYFVHAKGESRPHVLALIERMQRVLAAAPSK